MTFYNTKRKHANLEYKTPIEIHNPKEGKGIQKIIQKRKGSLIDYKQFINLILKKLPRQTNCRIILFNLD